MKFSPRRKFLAYVTGKAVLREHPMILLDIGCRGGVHRVWKEFGSHLRAYGFDPAPGEIDRLSQQEENKDIKYYSLAIGTAQDEIRLDDFVHEAGLPYVDFIKIDTDGHDLEVLRSSEETLKEKDVLGVMIEAPFVGEYHADSNTFHNIDRLLKRYDFEIYDIDLQRYASPLLPLPHDRESISTTVYGKVRWADVLYLGYSDKYHGKFLSERDANVRSIKAIKLACLCEMFRQPDTAVSIISKSKEVLDEIIDVPYSLDLLTPVTAGKKLSYEKYMQNCRDDPEWLRPTRLGFPAGADTIRLIEYMMADPFWSFIWRRAGLLRRLRTKWKSLRRTNV